MRTRRIFVIAALSAIGFQACGSEPDPRLNDLNTDGDGASVTNENTNDNTNNNTNNNANNECSVSAEIEDELDNDCDGEIDEGFPPFDDDGDCHCDSAVCNGGSVNDQCATVSPDDCDDANSEVGPGFPELADNLDNDCDGEVDEGFPGYDNDGDCHCAAEVCVGDSSSPACGTVQSGDCDDTDPTVFPGQTESCNGIDDNCVSGIDEEGATDCSLVYADLDGDGFGAGAEFCLCDDEISSGPYVELDGDCYDANAAAAPGAVGFFSADRGDGSFDYDCDNAETTAFNDVGGGCSLEDVGGGFYQCQKVEGWATAAPPGCGESATYWGASWGTCSIPNPSQPACQESTNSRVQACR